MLTSLLAMYLAAQVPAIDMDTFKVRGKPCAADFKVTGVSAKKVKELLQTDAAVFRKVIGTYFGDGCLAKARKTAKENGLFVFPSGVYFFCESDQFDNSPSARRKLYQSFVGGLKEPSLLKALAAKALESKSLDAPESAYGYVQSLVDGTSPSLGIYTAVFQDLCR